MRTRRPFVLACLMALICLVALPTAHAASKVSKYAYAAESGQIVVYTVNPDGGLRAIQAVANPLCIQPAVSPSNKFVYTTSNVNSQSIAGYSIGKTGTLTPLAGSPFASTGAHFLAFGKTGKFAYAVDNTASNDVEEFAVNATTGALTPIGTIFTGVYAGDITINPKGTVAYVANYGNNTISAFSINPTSGVLTAVSGSPFASGNAGPSLDRVSPNGKYLFSVNAANTGSISVFSINSKTGALTLISDNQFPAGWGYSGGDAKLDPSGKFLYVGSFSAIGVDAFSVNQTNGTVAAIGRYPAGSAPNGATVDASAGFLYVANTSGIAGEPPLFVFSINHSSGALTPVATYGQDGQVARNVLFSTGTASAAYTPTFAYATNSGSQSITELSIAKGGLGFVKSSPLTDSNGPQASVATADGKFFYTGNSNGSISEYAIGKTGALTKITGSPITGLANVTALAVDPFYQLLYAVDPTSDEVHTFQINPKTGVLTAGPVSALAGAPLSTAIDLDGLVFVTLSSSELDFGVDGFGFQGTVATGANPVAVTVDPSDQYVYVANSGGNSVSAFAIENRGFALTPVSGSPFAAGTSPSAVVAEPYGKYLYVANSGSSTISAYSIEPFTGALTPISGTFTTLSGPSALSVSNDGKYLYVTDKTAGELQQFTINSDGTLTAAGSAGLGTAPSSITAIGTYK